jgi:hypothetical protein
MALVMALGLAGCGGKGKDAETPANTATETPAEGTGAETGGETPAAPTGGDAGAGADTCVADCEQRNMARAVSADIIRKDCEAECAKQPSE